MTAVAIPPAMPADRRQASPPSTRRRILAALAVAVALLPLAAADVAATALAALAIFAAALAAWLVLRLPDAPVALAAAFALVLVGAVSEKQLFAALGDPLIWLLIGAFVIGAVLTATGAAQALALRATEGIARFDRLAYRLTGVIAATAFVIPSTTARATLLLPVFLALAAALRHARQVRALGLLFPTVILLSAAGSLLGAGAHLIAVDFMVRLGLPRIGFLHWLLLAAPFALLTSVGAAFAILHLFLTADERRAALPLPAPQRTPLSAAQRNALAIAGAVVLLWITAPLHGLDAALVSLAGALAATSTWLTGVSPKQALKQVEWSLVLFLAATLVIGTALVDSGAAQAIADGMLARLPAGVRDSDLLLLTAAALLALLAHLVVVSRSARALLLLPAVAVPVAALGGFNPAAIVLLCVIGSGFCQTFAVSAKPLAVFAGGSSPPFAAGDLLRLSAVLLLPVLALLVAFAWLVWPLLGLPLRG